MADSSLEDWTTKITEALNKVQISPQTPSNFSNAPIGIKLDGSNYALWSQVVEMYISGKDKLGYITGDSEQPLETDPSFRKWRTENAIVKGWLINSMDPSLIGNFIRFPTVKQVWDSIAINFFDGTDTSQVYDLRRRVTRMKQAGGSIEKYYNDLQGLWREIDFRRPNPMKCPGDIQKYNSILQEDRVYVFLDGLDDRLDKTRSDVLQLQTFPTVEQAYAHVRREDIRQAVMTSSSDIAPGAVMASKGFKPGKQKSKPQFGALKCTHCGNPKHTRETCFKLHGYPEWWSEFQARKKCEGTDTNEDTGRAAIASADSQSSLTTQPESTNMFTVLGDQGNCGQALVTCHDHNESKWIIDSGATDHMTFDSHNFSHSTQQRRTCIANANGVQYPVTRAGTVALSSSISLNHTLLVPSLSNKLLSINQVTTDLNCVVLMYPNFCLLQDILTKEIIGRGTKKGGLYYMDDFSSGKAQHTQHTSYAMHQKGYRCFDPITKRTYITMDVTFLEADTFYPSLATKSSLQGEPPNEEVNWLATTWLESEGISEQPNDGNTEGRLTEEHPTAEEPTRDGPPPLVPEGPSPENITEVSSHAISPFVDNLNSIVQYSLPNRHNRGKPPSRYSPEVEDRISKYPIANYVSTHRLSEPLKAFAHKLSSDYIPQNIEEALRDPQWSQAIKEELKALEKNKTWKYKARLVAKGYTQTYGIDYQETFSPVAKLNTVRVLLSVAANLNWPLHQLDVKNTFLHGKVTTLIVYVDDMIITGDDEEEITKLQKQLSTEFEMKNLGGLKYFLGIEMVGMLECKPTDTPIVQNHQLGMYADQVPTDKERYEGIVGKLIYLSYTRPDIAYAVSVNADWAGNISDRKSTSGYFTFVGENLVTWRSKKQKVVALSSPEAEFREMNLFCDNKAAIDISHNPIQHDRTKHVKVDRHFIKQNLEEKIIRFPFVKSEDQLADVLTKALSSRNFYISLHKLGIKDIYAPT
ncbi:uncharacterized protein LOC142504306 [Primulina tabacum]|uniref:uncharacterized protein LOC142504306 n=1 Tax=Primulina tabacum TaxID=48773 RepID=UPI003F5926D4